MAQHSSETIHGLPRPIRARGRSTSGLALRDLRDVEAYVIATLHRGALPLADGDLDRLVAQGIQSVYRLERALPPQQPLLPLLEQVLSARLAELWRSIELDRADPSDPLAAIAA
jgi:hypothetical protein